MRIQALSLALLSSLTLSLAACDSGGDDESSTTANATDGGTDGSQTSGPGGSEETGDPSGDPTDGETGDPTDGETGDPSGDPTGSGDGLCIYQCASDDDCLSQGMDIGLTCTDNGSCVNVCESDADCVAQLSGWEFQPCDSNDACAAGPCIDLGDGTGGCATEPSEFLDCATLMQAEVTVTDIDGTEVTVCGNDSGTCSDIGNGDMTCTLDTEVPSCEETGCPEGFTCGDEGACLCDSDEACGDDLTCGDDGLCTAPGCTSDDECTGALPFDGGSYTCI